MDNTVAYPNQPIGSRKKNSSKIIAVIIVLALLAVGFVLFRQSSKGNQPKVTVVEKQEPTPTPTPQIDKKTVKIQVLNGTGTPGQAASAVDALKNAGYSADNIKTDNAADYNHAVTTIAMKEGFTEIANDVKTALSSAFDNITVDSSPLSSDSEFDVVITTGGKKFEENTPTPSPTSGPTNTPAETPTITPTPSPTPTP
jgi:hypothetical protein